MLDFLQIVTEEKNKYPVAVPNRLRNKVHVGNFVLIQPTIYGSKHPAEIVKIIDTPYRRFYEANNLWPTQLEG